VIKAALINCSAKHNYYNQLFPENHFDPHIPGPATAIVDTGCTGNFIRPDSPHTKLEPTSQGIEASLPNKTIMKATHTCELKILPTIPEAARKAHIFPKLEHPLLSVGTLCDHGCEAHFSASKVSISYKNKEILTGPRDRKTNLWTIPLETKSIVVPNDKVTLPNQAHSAYHTTTKEDHVRFLHASAGSPVPSTWTDAINKGNYATWPGITSELVTKHLPKVEATIKGHMH
jgi:hypothetical protein